VTGSVDEELLARNEYLVTENRIAERSKNVKNPDGKAEPNAAPKIGAVFTVKPGIVEGCDCEDCRAGRYLYTLYRLTESGWRWAAISLKWYTSVEECKRKHWWGIEFGPNAVWEDGQPVVEPDPTQDARPNRPEPDANGTIPLNIKGLQKSFEAMDKHC